MPAASPDQVRKEKMVRQFRRIDQFLKSNSRKFYQAYDTHNATLERLREQIKAQEEEMRSLAENDDALAQEIQSVAEIDAADGVANRLNTMTAVLARIANRQLFNLYIKNRLPLHDLTRFSLRKIPWEADAILFITNPLMTFDLMEDFLKYRQRQSNFIYMYITNRIARLLFRFTQFVMVYDEFEKVVQLTFLHPKRFAPFKNQVNNAVHELCVETRECLLDQRPAIFLNDLRRLYLMLSRALFLSCIRGQAVPSEVKEMLLELNPVLDLDSEALHTDGIHEEFEQYHFTSPQFHKMLLDQYAMLQRQDIEYTFVFLGHIHPTDRAFILEALYQQSPSYVLLLFSKLREFYSYHGENLLPYYKYTANTIREIVQYEDVQHNPSVDESLKANVFWNETLYLGEKPGSLLVEEDELELAPDNDTAIDPTMSQSLLFDTLQNDPAEAQQKNYIFGLAGWPFCYLTIEYGKPQFHIFTLGEMILLDIPNRARNELIDYLLHTTQISVTEKSVIEQQMPLITDLVKRLVKNWKLKPDRVDMFDRKNRLKFYGFKQSCLHLHETFHLYLPDFLLLCSFKQFLLDTLLETERWLAREKNRMVGQIAPEWIQHFLESDQTSSFFESLKLSSVGRQYAPELKIALGNPELFKQQLVYNHLIKQKILEYERIRFADPVVIKTPEDLESDELHEEDSVEFLLSPYAVREKAFQEVESDEIEEKKPYYLEFARMPFRFMSVEFNKPRYVIFTLADAVVMNLGGTERQALLEFLRISRQLGDEELAVLKKSMIRTIMFIKQMCKNLQKAALQCNWPAGQIDFAEFAGQLGRTSHLIRREIPILSIYKDHNQMILEGLHEVERWIARERNKAIQDLHPEDVLSILKHPEPAKQAIEHIKQTPFGRQHLEELSLTPKSLQQLCQQLIKEYQLNVRLAKYYEKFQKI